MNIKDLYIDFFVSKGHVQIPSAPIIPENDPTVLFNTAGMQPLKPYLQGEPHPLGRRLTDFQKCLRMDDLEEVGDTTHHTFFEMLGNWSLGDYFKEESIKWSFEFLTSVLKIPVEKLAVTVFEGNDMVERDEESANIWMSLGIPKDRISYLGVEDNWWPNMELLGPCGPDTEIFYWRDNSEAPKVHDPNDERWVEIWNNVFMQYIHLEDGTFEPLKQKNVDTGMGVERTTAILEGFCDNYESSIWKPIIRKIEELSGKIYYEYPKEMRIIADHIRSIVIVAGDDAKIYPSNKDQGYILRRLIRRTIRYAKQLDIDMNSDFDRELALIIIEEYQKYYPELERNQDHILEVLALEKKKFARTLEKGLKEFERFIKDHDMVDGFTAFHLYDTYGFPIEFTEELAHEQGIKIDIDGFKKHFEEHQEKSRVGAEQKFKGGLSSSNDINTKYHTATHLLNAALKVVLGDHVHQMGSNITDERMRFDFSHPTKVSKEELDRAEALVNEWIKEDFPVVRKEMTKQEAVETGAEAMFIDKYGDQVTVYQIGEISKELCGGPHVTHTGELGHFEIKKEEASSAGVRRIKAILN